MPTPSETAAGLQRQLDELRRRQTNRFRFGTVLRTPGFAPISNQTTREIWASRFADDYGITIPNPLGDDWKIDLPWVRGVILNLANWISSRTPQIALHDPERVTIVVDVSIGEGELAQTLRDVPVLTPMTIYEPQSDIELNSFLDEDVNSRGVVYQPKITLPFPGDTVLVIWDGDDIYYAMGIIHFIRPE